jgi:hypothetical protein
VTENRENPQYYYEGYASAGGAIAQGPNSTATVNNIYGSRLPTIEEFLDPAAPDATKLMAQPSRLLDARSQVVPFVGREAELERSSPNGPRTCEDSSDGTSCKEGFRVSSLGPPSRAMA